MLDKTFGERLRYSRKSAGLTLEQLAQLIGVKRKQVVSNWEHDIAQPNLEILIKLSQVLNTSLDFLLGNSAGLLKGLDNQEIISDYSQDPTAPIGAFSLPDDENDETAGDINEENAIIYTAHIRKFMQDMHISPEFVTEFEAYVGYLRFKSKQSS